MNLEFYPVWQARCEREACDPDGFGRVLRAGGVREEQVALGLEKLEDVGVGILRAGKVCALERNRHHLGAARCECGAHRLG
jgi:hypothetical protein